MVATLAAGALGHAGNVPGEGVPPGPAVDPLRGRLHGKPAVQPGFHGSHVGVLDLDLGTSAVPRSLAKRTSSCALART